MFQHIKYTLRTLKRFRFPNWMKPMMLHYWCYFKAFFCFLMKRAR